MFVAELSLYSIPTLIIFKGGEMVTQIAGFRPGKEIAKRLDDAL